MLEVFFYIVLGAVLGFGLTRYVRRKNDQAAFGVYAQALVIASFIYVAFAMASMEDGWLIVAIGGVLLFLLFSYLGTKRSVWWLATGWFAHIAWDAAVHVAETVNFVPLWYPLACIGFDVILGGVIVRSYLQHRAAERVVA